MKVFSLFVLVSIISFSGIAQQKWIVDNPHSNVRYEVGWEDFSMRTGEFKIFEGTLVTNSLEDLSDAKFEFKVDAASVDAIAERLVTRIISDRFLNVENHPDITFYAEGAKEISENKFVTTGKITIVGVEKEQEVTILVKGHKDTPKGEIYGLEVSLQLNRMDFGLDWGSPRLAETISIVGHILYKKEPVE